MNCKASWCIPIVAAGVPFSLVLAGRHVIIRASLTGAGKPMAGSTKIEIRDVEHIYQSDLSTVPALARVSLTVGDGEFVALLGPSGCGKSSRPAVGISACAAIKVMTVQDVQTVPIVQTV